MSLQLLPLTESSPLLWTGFLGAATLVVALVVTIAIAGGMRATSRNSGTSSPTPSRQRRPHHDAPRSMVLGGQESAVLPLAIPQSEASRSPRTSPAATTDAAEESGAASGSHVAPRSTGASAPTIQAEPTRHDTKRQRPQRELAYRVGGGLEVTLLWSVVDNALTIRVIDHCVQTSFEMPVSPDRGSFAFHHPFAYAAEKSGHQSVAHAA